MESLIFRPSVTPVSSLILGWPYKPEKNVQAHPIDTYSSPWDVIVDPSVDTISTSQVIYPYYINMVGLSCERGVILRDRKDFNESTQMWWVSYRSGAAFFLQHQGLELIDIDSGLESIVTGCLYRIVTLCGFYIYEVGYDAESDLWVCIGKKKKLSTGTPVAPTDYILGAGLVNKKYFCPRAFVNYTNMHMFVMNRAAGLVLDFKGRVPACYTRLKTSESDQQV